jgi:hypothetical protein
VIRDAPVAAAEHQDLVELVDDDPVGDAWVAAQRAVDLAGGQQRGDLDHGVPGSTMAGQARDLQMTAGVRARRSSRPVPALFHLALLAQALVNAFRHHSRAHNYGKPRPTTALNAGSGTSVVLSKTKQASAQPTGQVSRRPNEPDRPVAETGCPCSVGGKERRHNRVMHIGW